MVILQTLPEMPGFDINICPWIYSKYNLEELLPQEMYLFKSQLYIYKLQEK